MKKLIVIFSVMAITGKVSAQGAGKVAQQDLHITTKAKPSNTGDGQGDVILSGSTQHTNFLTVELEDVVISSIKLNEGTNTLPVPGGKGRLKVVKHGTTFSDVIFTDAAGKSTKMSPTPVPSKPSFKITDNGNGTYLIGLLVPAVQKVREAAARLRKQ